MHSWPNVKALPFSITTNVKYYVLYSMSQGRPESVRTCFMNFALSFLIVGDNDIIRTILDTKGNHCADDSRSLYTKLK